MKVEIEIPDAALNCQHRFNADSGLCRCGLHIDLWKVLPDQGARE